MTKNIFHKVFHQFTISLLPVFLILGGVLGIVGIMAGSADIDTSFDTKIPIGFNYLVDRMIMQNNGKTIVAGGFSRYQGSDVKKVFRINADGTRDTSFNISTGFSMWFSYPLAIAMDRNDKVVVGGTITSYQGIPVGGIARLNPDATLDTGFNQGGIGFDQSIIGKITVQSDGKILVGGTFTSYNGIPVSNLIRLNTDGSLDTSFSASSFSNGQSAITVQSDGKILVGGWFTNYGPSTANKLIRLNADGSIDNSFNVGVGFNDYYEQNTINSIVVQEDGKIIIGGDFATYQGVTTNKIIRLNTDGSIDDSFNVGAGFNNPVTSILLTGDKILIGGKFTTYQGINAGGIISLNMNGSRDNSFLGVPGFYHQYGAYVTNLAIHPENGKIIAVGQFSTYNGLGALNIVCLNPDGSRDTSYYLGNGLDSEVYAIKSQNDGKIIVGGKFTMYDGLANNGVVRLNIDGSKDTSFNTWNGIDGAVRTLGLEENNKIVVGGEFSNKIVGLNIDGSRDISFDVGTGFNATVIDVAIQNDGKVLVAGGFTTYKGIGTNYITRLNTDGSIDTSFNIGAGFNNVVRTLKLQTDGKILVGGYFTTYKGVSANRIIRLNSDGSRDATFNIGVGFNSVVEDIETQSNGKILTIGNYTSYKGASVPRSVLRLNTDGSKDASFISGYVWDLSPSTIIVQSGDRVLIADTSKLVRLNADGSKDTSLTSLRFNNQIYALANRIDGGILVGGMFQKYGASIAGYLTSLYGDIPVVNLPNSTNTSDVHSAFTDQGYIEDNGTLIGSAPISLGVTDGNIPTNLNLSNENINLSILADTQFKDTNSTNYSGLISVPITKSISSVNDEDVIVSFNVGSNSDLITLENGGITISMPVPGQTIGNFVHVYYSPDNGVSWYFELTTQIIDKNGEAYIEFMTDHFGNFAVTEAIPDTTAPVITIIGDSSIRLNVGDTYIDNGATARDNIDGDVTANIIISGSVDTSIEGTYIITYKVSDAAGNQATIDRTVNITLDRTPPVITLIGDSITDLFQEDIYSEAGATAIDDVDGDITTNIIISGSVDTSTIGTYMINYNVSDTAGNQTTISRTVNVMDIALKKELNSGNIINIYNCPIDATYCDLSNQGIRTIAPNTFINHTVLEGLSLYGNEIMSFQSGTFNGLNILTELDISYNKLTSIPKNIFSGVPNLYYLYLAGNQIHSIKNGDLSDLPDILQELSLDGNQITFIEDTAFQNLSNLQYLYLHHNQIPSLQSEMFRGLNSLVELQLNNNQISSIENGTFSGLPALQGLYLYENKITSLNNGIFDGLDSIQQIALYNNPIISVQTGVFNELPNLGSFSFYNSCDNKLFTISNYLCSDPQYTDEISCLAQGWCTNGVSNNQTTCESVGFCRDGESLDKSTCEANGSSWNKIYSRITNNNRYSNGPAAQMDTNYCSILNTEEPSLFTQELLNKGYINGGGLLGLGSDYYIGNYALRFAPGFVNGPMLLESTSKAIALGGEAAIPLNKLPESFGYAISSLRNQFLANTIMQSSNTNGYIQDYYNNNVEVEYPIGTDILSGGQEFVGVLHSPTLFTTAEIPQMSGAISLVRFGALTHGVTFSAPITIRVPALGRNIGDQVSIYSSDKENIYLPSGPSWIFEQTGTVVDINGIPYVQFTTTHASWYVLSSTEIQDNTNTGNTGDNTGGSSGGGSSGGGSSFLETDPVYPEEDKTHGTAELTGDIETFTGGSIEGSLFSPDINEAYLWAYSLGITTIPTIQEANIEGNVYRSHMAKMLTEYATKVLKRVPNTGVNCIFTDMKTQSQEMQIYAIKACQLGLMGLKSNGTPNPRFHPTDVVTRAQFGTVLSRLLYGSKYNVSASEGVFRYSKHLQALKKAGIMTKITKPMMKELRGNIFIMLMRSAKK